MFSRLSRLVLYWNTLRYLRPVQITGRLKRILYKPRVRRDVSAQQRAVVDIWQRSAQRECRMVSELEFTFLNETHTVQSASDWNHPQWEKLWLYNLHYFDDLIAEDGEQRGGWHRALIQRWIAENPPGTGNGWEPYPTSLRIVNWVKWGLAGNELEDNWLDSLAVQAVWLERNLETHLLGNHLFANAKALIYAGLFLQGEEAERWYETGKSLVERELPVQVLSDGANFELSTMYHLIFLEDLLDLVNIHRVYGREFPPTIAESIPRMFQWMERMCHPDGEIAFFNDAAIGVTPSVAEIRAYGERLGFCSEDDGRSKVVFAELPDSGYSRIEVEDAVAIVDRAAIGPDYLPGHAHADTLSFELSLFGRRVVVNSGTSVYGTGVQRQIERGTSAHSTVLIDNENSSEVWGGFRVARRAKVLACDSVKKDGKWVLSAYHDGYCRLSGKPVHHREWSMGHKQMVIRDRISGQGVHNISAIFPIHPQVTVDSKQPQGVMLHVDHHPVEMMIEGEGELELRSAYYHPEFGCSVENFQLVYSVQQPLPIEITTRISW